MTRTLRSFRFLACIGLLAALVSHNAEAQALDMEIMSGTVSDKGVPSTYLKMVGEFRTSCKGNPAFPNLRDNLKTTGSNASSAALLNNEVSAIVGQADVMHWLKRSQDTSGIVSLAALHREQVHFVAKASTQTGGWVSKVKIWDNGDKTLRTVEQLDGARVGVVDGSGAFTTARLIRDAAALPYSIVAFPDWKSVMSALDAGVVMAAVTVGGKPVPSLKELSREYRLLSVSKETQGKLADSGYTADNLSYPNLAMGGEATTISTRAVLFAPNKRSPRWVAAYEAIQDCLNNTLEDIRDTPGTHPAWKDVKPNAPAWPLWERPSKKAAEEAPTPAPAKGKKA